MKRFAFGLERILAWRRLQRDEEQVGLQKMLDERASLLERERLLRRERDGFQTGLSRALHFDAQDVATLPHWQARVKKTLVRMSEDVALVDGRIVDQRNKLREAERKVQLLERLRQRRLQDWKLALDRVEEAFASEMFLARSVRLKRDCAV